MVRRNDRGIGDRPDISEFDGLRDVVDDVEAALEDAERNGEEIKWMKVRPPIIAIDFPRSVALEEMVEFYDEYLSEIVPADDYEAKLIDFKIFGRAIEIYPSDYPYEKEEMPNLANETGGGVSDE